MLDWFISFIMETFSNSRVAYAFIVVISMAGMGTVIGALVEIIIVKATGIKLDTYTDNHTG